MQLQPHKLFLLITCIVFGIILVISYIPIIKLHRSSSFDFWLGLRGRKTMMLFVVLAIIGMACMIIQHFMQHDDPASGSVIHSNWFFPSVLTVILVFSILWSVFILKISNSQTSSTPTVQTKALSIACSASLVVVALGAILICVSQSTRINVDRLSIIGAILFAITTVIVDGIIWNSRLLSTVFT